MQDVSSAGNDTEASEEIECKRCRGTGEDRYLTDCRACDGFGTLIVIGIHRGTPA